MTPLVCEILGVARSASRDRRATMPMEGAGCVSQLEHVAALYLPSLR